MFSAVSTIRRISKLLTLFTCIIASCTAVLPPRNDAQHFSIHQLIGPWYVIAETATEIEDVDNCARFIVQQRRVPTKISTHTTFTSINSQNKTITYEGEFTANEGDRIQWETVGSPHEGKRFVTFQYRIVAFEKDKHAVIFIHNIQGSDEIEGVLRGRDDFGMILGPRTDMPLDELSELSRILHSYSGSDRIVSVNQNDCPE